MQPSRGTQEKVADHGTPRNKSPLKGVEIQWGPGRVNLVHPELRIFNLEGMVDSMKPLLYYRGCSIDILQGWTSWKPSKSTAIYLSRSVGGCCLSRLILLKSTRNGSPKVAGMTSARKSQTHHSLIEVRPCYSRAALALSRQDEGSHL